MTAERAEKVDVVVIGAGPGGSAAAAKLAQAGCSVLMLERRAHPRFHIGESMLPSMNAVCERLGVFDRIKEQGYVPKHGAEFSLSSPPICVRVPFSAQGPGRHHSTFQVERAHFDRLLAEFASDAGAVLRQNANAEELLSDGGRITGVRYRHNGAQCTAYADYVVDAGGRASPVSQKFGLRKQIDRMRMVAVFRHFKGLDERCNPGEEGDIMIAGHEDGWLWAIPIWPDTISVGSVMKRDVLRGAEDPEDLLAQHINRSDRITKRLYGTRPHGKLHIETDYCYYSDQIAGPGWFMVGDAACFFDPIFSGGTFLALATGYVCAETIDAILADPAKTESLQRHFSNFYKTGYDLYARIIYAYYDGGFNIQSYIESIAHKLGEGTWYDNKWVVRQLAGDFWSLNNQVNRAIVREARWDTFAPFDRVWESPFHADEQVAAEQESPAPSQMGGEAEEVAVLG